MGDVNLGKAFNRGIVCIIIMVFIPVFVPIVLNFDPIRECMYFEEYAGSGCFRTELEIYFWNSSSNERSYIDGYSFYLRGSHMYKVITANITNVDCERCAPDTCEEKQSLAGVSVFDFSPPTQFDYIGGGLCDDPSLKNESIPRHVFESRVENIAWKAFMVKMMGLAIFGIFCISSGRLFLMYLISKT